MLKTFGHVTTSRNQHIRTMTHQYNHARETLVFLVETLKGGGTFCCLFAPSLSSIINHQSPYIVQLATTNQKPQPLQSLLATTSYEAPTQFEQFFGKYQQGSTTPILARHHVSEALTPSNSMGHTFIHFRTSQQYRQMFAPC